MLRRVRSEEFRYGGATLRYEVSGRGEPVVLIHGLSGSAQWWRRNVPALAAEYRVYALDLAGYGHARRQRTLGVQENAELIARWMEALDLRGAALIGHSMGGQIAVRVAALNSGRVDALVLACASGLLAGNPVRVALQLPRATLTGRPTFLPRILADSVRAGLPNLWRSAVSLLGDSVADLLPALDIRTLVIWGRRDALVPVALGRQLAAAIPGAEYREIARAGHVVMVDAPREFNAAVLDFLRRPGAGVAPENRS
jgi:pimeloyl-ACP methyl ester carboxylesterase